MIENLRFIAWHAVENIYSGRVMEKIGMKFDRKGTYTGCDGQVFNANFYIMDLD